ncbi:non-hydrolyzing UDP-N-acetylglucosamine 2-epimerase [Actinopolymorpha pittospori]|nr:UDP-N-acetylglucosamine 2-epimerase (non-hydrolyzing) [Actinopolymorpha pittospori]
MTIVGTRPEIIRLSRVIARLDESLEHVLVHTGQNYDRRLSEIFFEELELRRPDHHLNVDTSSLGRVLGETLIKSEEVLRAERPDAVLVLGDTNSSIAVVIAKRLHIPVYHMEAGNRCFDENVPEETNRRLVDHVADFNLVYTEHARRNLLAEGLHPRRILLTGSPMREVIEHYRPRIDASQVVDGLGLTDGGYFLVSAHREENVDSRERLRMLLDTVVAVRDRWNLPVLVSTHPRTRKRLEALSGWEEPQGIDFHDPFGYFDYVKLQTQAACVLSDSGTISEESAILDFPAVTMRAAIERPESLDSGSIVTAGIAPTPVLTAVQLVTTQRHRLEERMIAAEYDITNCSARVVNFVVSTAHSHHEVAGIRRPNSDGHAKECS